MYQLDGFERDFIYADINAGIDYERALQRLNARAGQLFRRYREAKHDLGAEAERVVALREEYREALQNAKALSPHDAVAIRQILKENAPDGPA